jgi:signal peptide peptidase SppA
MTAPTLFRDPWCISEEHLQLVIAIASRDEFFAEVREQALAARDGRPLQNTRAVTVRDGVAVIPVAGPLFRHANLMTDISGATSYSTLRKDLQVALDDPSVRAIMLDIDSPGGELNGVSELASAVYDARGKKPIKAYVGGMGASAAYWIASAADEVIAADTAMLGSIGVVYAQMREDPETKARTVEIVSSQSPHKRMDITDDADRARLQARIDALADVFIDAVARNRGVDRTTVIEKFGRGDLLVGENAVAAGLADRVGNFEAVLEELAAGGTQMNMKRTIAALALPESAAVTDDEIGAAVEALKERAEASEKQVKALVAAAGGTDVDDAIGKINASKAARAELEVLRAEQAAAAAAQVRAEFRATLAGAQHLTLGQLVSVIPTMLDEGEEEKARKAFDEAEAQTASALIDALLAVDATGAPKVAISPSALKRTRSFVASLGPAFPRPKAEPAPDPELAAISDEEKRIAEMAERNRKLLFGNKPTTK